ncbi:MAG: integrase family protein, partial [Rhodospirillales bacterium]
MRLTDIVVRSLSPPERGAKVYPDDQVDGFGVRVSQGGTKAFVLTHGRGRERITLGRYPIVSLADARTEAKRLLAERTLGKHRPQRMSFEDALKLYVTTHLQPKTRPITAKGTEALIRNHFARVKHKSLEDVRAQDVTAVTDKLLAKGQPGAAAHAFTAVKGFLRWCVRRRYLQHDPIELLPVSRTPGLGVLMRT